MEETNTHFKRSNGDWREVPKIPVKGPWRLHIITWLAEAV